MKLKIIIIFSVLFVLGAIFFLWLESQMTYLERFVRKSGYLLSQNNEINAIDLYIEASLLIENSIGEKDVFDHYDENFINIEIDEYSLLHLLYSGARQKRLGLFYWDSGKIKTDYSIVDSEAILLIPRYISANFESFTSTVKKKEIPQILISIGLQFQDQDESLGKYIGVYFIKVGLDILKQGDALHSEIIDMLETELKVMWENTRKSIKSELIYRQVPPVRMTNNQ